jgi:hypothetical protein
MEAICQAAATKLVATINQALGSAKWTVENVRTCSRVEHRTSQQVARFISGMV